MGGSEQVFFISSISLFKSMFCFFVVVVVFLICFIFVFCEVRFPQYCCHCFLVQEFFWVTAHFPRPSLRNIMVHI